MAYFSVWAPRAGRVDLVVGDGRSPMRPGASDGWWELDVPSAGAGTGYAFSLDGGDPRPDPRSRRQPQGVHRPSRVVDPDLFAWTDADWPGRELAGSIVYELHIGTFTPEGTFDSAIGRLDHLADLGIDLVEVMPVAAFPGHHGWGYDGVDLWAVHDPYGGPDGFRRFVDACHARGMGVVLDVVYNHLGPSGNYLAEFGPYFTDKYRTPWGSAVNLDDPGSDEVRSFIRGNALHWFRDYHLDALRLDAVHALTDARAIHALEELSIVVDRLAAELGRPLTLIAESDRNDPRIITRRDRAGFGIHAQWDDDVHHCLHALLTGERQGYYADFGSIADLAKTLTEAYFHNGTWSSFRGRHHGRPVDTERLTGDRFVAFLQDHDQIGNRALGDRISASLSPGLMRVGAALLLTSPFTPMLFMGEEWGASTPWQYFTDHTDPELGRAVSQGRRREFARHGWAAEDIPDPQARETYVRSILNWNEVNEQSHSELLAWYGDLIALRKQRAELADPWLPGVVVDFDEAARWIVIHRGSLRVVANLAAAPQSILLDKPATTVLLASDQEIHADADTVSLPAESVAVIA